MKKVVLKFSIALILTFILFNTKIVYVQTVYTVNPDKILHTVDEKVYGHFLEHIYNSVNNGLWGDLVWNRSFERLTGSSGEWSIDNDEVIQSSLSDNVRLMFGSTTWTDYEFTVEAQKTDGNEGFLILFRANGESFYWANFGGWNNTQHAIEKGTPGVRWSIFGSPVPGSITSGKWYFVRIRCEGNQFQVWLDDTKFFDFTDNNAHLSGQTGVGTWITQAKFRNFLVTELSSGDTLFSGLPDLGEDLPVVFQNWENVNSIPLYSGTDALNSNFSLKMINDQSSEAGIQQNNFNLTAQNYEGSLWAKGSMPGKLKVSLLNGSTVLDEEELEQPTTDWQEHTFQLNPSAATTNGTLKISFNDTGTVYLDQISMMGQDAIDNNGYRPDLYEAVEALKPPIIRWPGGCYASAYFWKDGIGPQHTRQVYPIELWNDQDVNSYGTDEFLQMCEAMGAEPLIVVNTGVLNSTCGVQIPIKLAPESYLQDALDWMEYCNGDAATTTWGAVRAANGHPEPYNVKYWEIDNETWSAGISAYIAKVKEFAPAMRAKFPDVKIIACGSGSYDYSWNNNILNECADIIDYISTHHYESQSGYRTGVSEYENFIEQLGNSIATSSNPDIKIYMSEWNLWSGIDWRIGLYAGGMLNVFERNGDVFEIGGPALFLRHQSANAWDNAFINFNNSDWFPAPNYVVMKLWHDHYAPNYIESTGSHNDLNVVSTLSEDGDKLYFKVVNTSNSDIPVTLAIDSSFTPRNTQLKQIAPASLSARNSLSNPNNIHVEEANVEIDNQQVNFTIPKYAAAVVMVDQNPGTGIKHDKNSNSIKKFLLYPNYPNPFNSVTTIHYDLPKTAYVKLQVIDVLGRIISVLVNDKQESGRYQVEWHGKDNNGNHVSSGLYFYELITSSNRIRKKMIFIQ